MRSFRLALLILLRIVLAPSGATGESVHSEGMPEAIRRVTPIYPDSAWRAGLEDTIIVMTLIDTIGSATKVRLLEAAPAFERAAMHAAMEWTFTPAIAEGKAIKVWVPVPFVFRLAAPAMSARVRADTLWSEVGVPVHPPTRSDREQFLKRIDRAVEVWIFQLDPDDEGPRPAGELRQRFARRKILGDLEVDTDSVTCRKLRNLLADVHAQGSPRPNKRMNKATLGIRFVAEDGVVDALISLRDRGMVISDGEHLRSHSLEERWREWARVAHSAFPKDRAFARLAKSSRN